VVVLAVRLQLLLRVVLPRRRPRRLRRKRRRRRSRMRIWASVCSTKRVEGMVCVLKR
jgi:hypothetical protein